MKKNFHKEITIKEMLLYLLNKWWIIVGICVLAGILSIVITGRGGTEQDVSQQGISQEPTYILQDGNYVYATVLNVRAETTTEVVSSSSYLGLIISKSSITAAIDELGLEENFIDIFNKMSWEIVGENIKLKISSPLQEIDGYSWEEVLGAIANEGERTIKEYYKNVIEIRTIDEPYLENALVKKAEDSQKIAKTGISKRDLLLAVLISGVLACSGILVIFLLKEDIVTEKEIEENLGIPVLVVIDKRKAYSNIIRR